MNAQTSNLYDILGVSAAAPDAVIAAAYRALAKTAHPDAGGDTEAFQRIEQAYSTLSDPLKRAEYDRSLRSRPGPASTASAGQPHTASPSPGPGSQQNRPAGPAGRPGAGRPTGSGASSGPGARPSSGPSTGAPTDDRPGHGEPQWASFTWTTPPARPVVVHPPITWPVTWRFGLLGLAFCSFVGDVFTKIPRPVGYAAGLIDGMSIGFAMLMLALGAAAVAVRFRPQVFRGQPVLPWIYAAAGALSVAVLESNAGFSSTAVLLGVAGVFVGSRDVEVRRVLLGAARPSRPAKTRQRIEDLARRASGSASPPSRPNR